MDVISLKKNWADGQVFDEEIFNTNMTDIETAINKLLGSVTDGDSGADAIKATPISGLGDENTDTVQKMLEELFSNLQGVALGEIPDGTITNAKLVDNTIGLDKLASEVNVVPSGLISMWHGLISAIPTGWLLCDGTNGTPDLTEKFIMGVTDQEDMNDTGGANETTLSTSELPEHTHTATTSTDGSHTHNLYNPNTGTNYQGTGGSNSNSITTGSSGFAAASTTSGGSHSHTLTTDSTGSGTAYDSRPAYYTLAFIMKS